MTITRILLTSFTAGLAMGTALVAWPDSQGIPAPDPPAMHYAPGQMPSAESPYNCLIYVDNVWLECRAIYRIRDA